MVHACAYSLVSKAIQIIKVSKEVVKPSKEKEFSSSFDWK